MTGFETQARELIRHLMADIKGECKIHDYDKELKGLESATSEKLLALHQSVLQQAQEKTSSKMEQVVQRAEAVARIDQMTEDLGVSHESIRINRNEYIAELREEGKLPNE